MRAISREQLKTAKRVLAVVDPVSAGNKKTANYGLLMDLKHCLMEAVLDSGFSLSGPSDWKAAENGEPKWVCRARGILAGGSRPPSL